MIYRYYPKGVCSTQIDLELDGNIIKNVSFTGGCNGNLKAISSLVKGLTVDQVQERLSGIRCGMKSTSCSDQLARAIVEAYEKSQQ